jgi:regulator of replication initiation timing
MDMNRYYNSLENKCEELEKEVVNLRTENTELKARIEGLISENCQLSRTYQAARANIRALED